MVARGASGWLAALLALPTLLGAVAATPAWAGSLSVMPIRVDVAAGKRFCSLTLGNDADRPLTVQVRAFAWTRDEAGADLLQPDPGFIVNPTITTIAPGTTRLVRCSLPAGDPSAIAEQQWRLVVDQLPEAIPTAPGTVQTLLRISLPVFRADDKAAPHLTASIDKSSLRLANAGTRHVKVLAVMLKDASADVVSVERPFYLLAGGAQVIPLPRLPRGGGASMVHVRAEEGEFDIALPAVQ